MAPDNGWVSIIVLLLSGGGAKFLYDTYKDWRDRPNRATREVNSIEQSIVTVARARDELAEDNDRLRLTLSEERRRWDEERSRYDRDRAGWQSERMSLRDEIAVLEKQVRDERAAATRRYDALLERLSQLSARHAPKEG